MEHFIFDRDLIRTDGGCMHGKETLHICPEYLHTSEIVIACDSVPWKLRFVSPDRSPA